MNVNNEFFMPDEVKLETDENCIAEKLAELKKEKNLNEAVQAALKTISTVSDKNPIAGAREAYYKFGAATKGGLNYLEKASLGELEGPTFRNIEQDCKRTASTAAVSAKR